MRRLLLVPFGPVEPELMQPLRQRLSHLLPFEIQPEIAARDPEPAFDPRRGQTFSTRLLDMLSGEAGLEEGDRLLGVTERDLFIPILTFVFGEAQLAGPAAVFSTHRLRPTFYGLPPDPEWLLERSVKEAVHELGHTFGLLHCRRTDCVMRSSTVAEDVDLKPASFCRDCARVVYLG